ncbi:MAG TPA: autotransporter domain-containing protein [Devosia sp.]|nr:autotransporter domain-containing protein [Devosia sp.]
MLLGVAAATLSGVIAASADDVSWSNNSPVESRWEDADNWSPAATPAPGDIVTIGTGNSGLYTGASVGTVNVDGGVLWINRNGVLKAGTVNVSGGQLALSKGNPTATTNPGPQGIANISTLLNITGGTVERFGLIDLGDTGTVTQSGGEVLNPVQIHTPSYLQTGGSMVGQVTASTYAISGAEGAAESLMAGTVYIGSQFTMADGAQVTGSVAGDGSATMVQTGGTMDGAASGLTSYTQTGGTLAGDIEFSNLFELSGDGQIGWVNIIGSAEAEFKQSGGISGGVVFAPVGSEDWNSIWTGIAKYTQTGGDMAGGWVITRVYEASGGSVNGSVDFLELFALSGDASVGDDFQIMGARDAVMTQSGGSMGGDVYGKNDHHDPQRGSDDEALAIASYTQSGGDMTGFVAADDYALSGGTLSGTAAFSSFELIDGEVKASGRLIGASGATMTQDGGKMSGTVSGLASYTQSGGTITGTVTTALFDLAGGTGASLDNVTITETLRQSGGTLTRDDYVVPNFTQAGGAFSGTIGVQTYNLEGAEATSSGTITASDAFNLGVAIGTATIGAKLSGTGRLVKSGASTVVLANEANDFSGSVAVNGGVLEVRDAALPGEASITVADTATLRFNTAAGTSTQFDGIMSGATGVLEKTGQGTLTLGGDINLGALQVSAGVLNIGNGAPEEASFESAYIGVGSTVYVASGATLRVRIPKNIANFGTLTNDGTVYDDLDNAGMFVNNAVYVANVASNTRDIANNSPGVWTGDVLANNGWINNNENATWNGNVVSNGALGSNGQPGRIANAGGTWRGDILSNAGHIINDNRADEIGIGYWIGDIYSNTNWIFNGGGGDWDGDVITNAGSVMNGKPAVWHGDVRSNANQVWNGGLWNGKVLGNAGTIHNAGGTWNGNVEANTGLIANIAGTDAHGPTTGSTWNGDVTSNAGDILNAADSSWSGNVLSNSGTISTLGLWTGNFSNAGTVQAQNRIVGAFVNSGTLQLTGDLSGITALTNSGTIDMKGGGSQVLSVASANFASGSFLDVQVDPNGTSDRVAVSGAATLGGTVRISGGAAPHTDGPFTILTAASFSGAFDAVTTDLAFLAPHLSYDPQAVAVVIQRNDVGFGETGASGNQMAVGAAIEALGAGNPLYDAVLWLTQTEAQSALDQLSGEPHASQARGAMESASVTGQIAANRVAQAFAVLAEGGSQVSSYAEAARPIQDGPSSRNALWGQFYGARGVVDAGSGNAAVTSSNGGVVLGLDGVLGDWRLGLMLQGGSSGTQVAALNASASSTDYGVGFYGGKQFGDTLLSFGATYTRHDNSATRQVSFPGFTDTLSANYASGTTQVFGNVSHEFDFGAVSLKPYAGLAHVSHATDGFSETGGPAALSSAANVINATFASLGLGVEQQFVVGEDMLLTASGSVGWRHGFVETPISVNRFGAGPAFAVTGRSAASDVLTLGAGLALDVGGGINLDVTYDGQIGNGTQTHAVQGAWAKRF